MTITKGQKHVPKFYWYVSWLFPLVKLLTPQFVCPLSEVGKAMVNAAKSGYEKNVVEVRDIKILAGRTTV